MLACLAALVGYAFAWPDEAWRGYYDDGYLSKFSRSGVTAVSDFINYGFMESAASVPERLKVPLVDSCHPAGRRPHIIMVHDEVELRHSSGQWHQGAAGLWQPFQIVRRQGAQIRRREQWRPELVHRIQCAGRALLALVRPLLLFRDPHRLRPRRARPAAGAAPLRLLDAFALSGLWRVHERAQFPDHHRHPALPRCARSRRQGRRARRLLLRQGVAADLGTARQYAAVHLRLSRRQSFPLGNQIPLRPDAVLAQSRQRAGGRRISAPAGDERQRLFCVRRLPEEEISRRSRF